MIDCRPTKICRLSWKLADFLVWFCSANFREIRSCDESRPFRSSALSFPGAKSPQRELSLAWNFRSVEHSLLVPIAFCTGLWTFAPFVPRERTFQELSFLWNCCSIRTNIPRTFALNVLKHDLKLAINLCALITSHT